MKKLSEVKIVQNDDFIIENMIKVNGIYSIVAAPKTGKSFMGLQIANCVVNALPFLDYRTNKCFVFLVNTEIYESELFTRIIDTNSHFTDENFSFIDPIVNGKKISIFDLELELQKVSNININKLIIIDILNDIDFGINYDLNSYQDIGQKIFPKLRDLCNKYNTTIIFIHHLNKRNETLGSTAIDSSVDGIFTLKQDKNVETVFYLNYISRHYKSMRFTLTKDENLRLIIDDSNVETLNSFLQIFLNYAIKQKEFEFTAAEITSKLNLLIEPSTFGKLLKNNKEKLERLGLHIEENRTSDTRKKYAKYEEPIEDD